MKGASSVRLAFFRLLFAAIFVFPALLARAQSVASLPQPTDYVNDFAHVLSPEAVARLDSICQQLDHSTAHAQVAVVTVHDLAGDTADDYADDLESKWKMGKKGSDRGVLVLLAVADHKYRIEVGYGLEGILPDGKIGDIGREMVPDLRAGDYDGAITLAVGEIAQVIAADANVTLQEQPAQNNEQAPASVPVHHHPTWVRVLQFLVIAVFILFYLLRVFGSMGLFGAWGLGLMTGGIIGRGRGGYGGGFGGGGGGFGGGGGGFGGFGGGSFGGGGAGGSW
jgi:uncharacterized protein